MDLSIVLPVHDEKGNLIPLHREIKDVMKGITDDHEIIFVDDGSADKSFEEMKKIRENDNKVKILKFKKNFGQSVALQAGFDYARGDVIVTMDADFQNDPKDIPKLLEKLNEGFDCVSGWRQKRKDPLEKRIFSKIASKMRRKFIDAKTHDYGCALKAFKRDCLKDLELYGEMHRYIPPLLRWKGHRIEEVEVNHRERRNGKTKYNWQRLGKGFIDMINVWFWQKYSNRPLHIFGGLGLVLFSLGFIGLLYSFYQKLFFGMDLTRDFLPVGSFLTVIIGVNFFVSGLLADIALKNYYSGMGRKTYTIEEVVR